MWRSYAGAGVLVVRDGRVLMILRERSGEICWELPSGLVEHGESLEAAATREVFDAMFLEQEIKTVISRVESPPLDFAGARS